ncbi:hypothetical protein DPMN_154310 [Dreissena polymorpha]|uniref:Uncharacterized protein n=1 Tax=Dreissena polymorpha TaxID=45954 RepID=A0A9D4FRJ2_DREPO|nr:hypothetical protein DPMN_154310 [Dreissena polymorpha]
MGILQETPKYLCTNVPYFPVPKQWRMFADHNNSYYIQWFVVTVVAKHCHIRPPGKDWI